MKLKKNVLTFCLVWLAAAVFGQTHHSKIDDPLWEKIQNAPNDYHRVLIVLTEQADIAALDRKLYVENATLERRAFEVITTLETIAQRSQNDLLFFLRHSPDVLTETVQPFYIINAVEAEVKASVINTLSQWDAVGFVALIIPAKPADFAESCEDDHEMRLNSPNGVEPGLVAIKAPLLWKMGYTGHNRVACVIDSGTDYTHPALDAQWRGNYVPTNQAWFNGASGGTPSDCDGHGTHVTGTICGLNVDNQDTIGVAPNAFWIASPPIQCSNITPLSVLQWTLNPDGNNQTISDMPDVANNSWYDSTSASTQCSANYFYRNAAVNLEAAGVAVIWAAGNFGPGVSTITPPANHSVDLLNIFSVGAVDGNSVSLPIAGFSSRGPSICTADTGAMRIKPEVSAPGVSVRSCIPNNKYASFQGTSMATPHVAGAILLLKQAFPNLTGTQLKEALYYTAVDLGTPGEDNVYGRGMIDVFAAFQYLVNQGNTPANPHPTNEVALVGIGGLSEIICDPQSQVSPTATIQNNGTDTLFSAVIKVFYNSTSQTINWTGNLPPNGSAVVQLATTTLTNANYHFRVEVSQPNGVSDERLIDNKKSTRFFVSNDPSITANGATVCQNGNALLHATHPSNGEIRWYNSPTSNTVLATGNSFVTPNLTTDASYFADVFRTQNIGRVSNSGSTTLQSTNLNSYLLFDCYAPFRLKSVKVYTNTLGGRRIVLRDSDGNVIAQKLISISTTGEQRISLNFTVNPGEDYELGVELNASFFVNIGANAYPYTVPNVLSIKNSSGGVNQYVYFYDWEIEYNSPCGRTEVMADVVAGSHTTNFSQSTDTIDLFNQIGDVQFTDNSNGATAWFWDFGDGTTDNAANPLHNYTLAGNYQVSLSTTNTNGCTDAASSQVIVLNTPTSADGQKPINGTISLFPNPTDAWLNLQFDLHQPTAISIAVVDMVGRIVQLHPKQFYQQENLTLDLQHLPNGIYFVRMQHDGGVMTHRVVVAR